VIPAMAQRTVRDAATAGRDLAAAESGLMAIPGVYAQENRVLDLSRLGRYICSVFRRLLSQLQGEGGGPGRP